jgi:hypothetical protein
VPAGQRLASSSRNAASITRGGGAVLTAFAGPRAQRGLALPRSSTQNALRRALVSLSGRPLVRHLGGSALSCADRWRRPQAHALPTREAPAKMGNRVRVDLDRPYRCASGRLFRRAEV